MKTKTSFARLTRIVFVALVFSLAGLSLSACDSLVKSQIKNTTANSTVSARLMKLYPSSYPGLKSHEGHRIARKQMSGFGGMLSF